MSETACRRKWKCKCEAVAVNSHHLPKNLGGGEDGGLVEAAVTPNLELERANCVSLLARGEFRPRQTRQLPRAVDLKGRLLSCQSY